MSAENGQAAKRRGDLMSRERNGGEFDYRVRGMLVAQSVLSLDDSELERATEGVCGAGVLPSAKRQRDEGLTVEALYREFGREVGDWLYTHDDEPIGIMPIFEPTSPEHIADLREIARRKR